jgi:hypothetical protein
MTDIVERLRRVSEFGGTHLDGLWTEAADHIEELEADHADKLRNFAIGYEEGKVESEARIEQLEADNGAYEGGLLKRDFDNDILRSDNARLEALLTEAATELEDDAIGRVTPRKHYPTEAVRYARDMDLPNRIRAALNPEETK